MNILSLIIALSLLFTATLTVNSFQERVIYDTLRNNVCSNHLQRDLVFITLQVSDGPSRDVGVLTKTSCRSQSHNNTASISPAKFWSYSTEEGDRILFEDETRYVYEKGKLSKIVQKAILVYPIIKLHGITFNCTLNGSGTEQDTWSFSEIKLDCTTLAQDRVTLID